MSPPKRMVIKTIKYPRILVLPDKHFPFVSKRHLQEVVYAAKDLKPTHIVDVGDTYDLYSFSKFTRSLNLITPAEEIEQGRAMAEEMWRNVKANAPKARCYQLRGNHEERLLKKIMEKAPEYESLVKDMVNDLTQFKGVTDLKSSKAELVINDIVFIHGWSTTPGYHARYFLQSVIHGHTHHGGVVFMRHKGKTLYELDCGYLADEMALPLDYRETVTSKWTLGFGFVDERGPRFIPL